MTLTRWAVAHDDSTTTLPADDAIIAALILLLVLVVDILVVPLLRGCPPMLLIVLSVIHGLLGDGFVPSIVLSGWNRWVSTTLLVLTLQMLRVLL